MAFLSQDDQNQQNQQNGQTQDPNGSTTSGSSPLVNSGGAIASGSPASPSMAGVGAGGSGWTNIQSYLNANQGNNGSATALQNQVGGEFDKEQSQVNQETSDTKKKADSSVAGNKIGQDQASQLIQQAGSNYNYNGPQSQAYQDATGKLSGSLSAQYGGPTSYAHTWGGQTQTDGQGLGSDQGFQGVMQNVYNQAAGGQMGSGAMALQGQLDQNNSAVNQTRQNLLQQYAGLQGNVNNAQSDVNQYLTNDQNQFKQDQGDLKSYLSGQGTTNKGAIDNAVSDFETGDKNGNSVLNLDKLNSGINGGTPMDQAWVASQVHGSLNPYMDYKRGTEDESNIQGVDDQRNRYNSIMDVLGMGTNKINKSDQGPAHGGYNYDLQKAFTGQDATDAYKNQFYN